MVYTNTKIEAYYNKIELIVLTIVFLVSFGAVLLIGILADRSSLISLLIIAFVVSMSICGGMEGYTILKILKTTSETFWKFIILILIAFPIFIGGILMFWPHYIYSIRANIKNLR